MIKNVGITPMKARKSISVKKTLIEGILDLNLVTTDQNFSLLILLFQSGEIATAKTENYLEKP
jgi:hypothetical protein